MSKAIRFALKWWPIGLGGLVWVGMFPIDWRFGLGGLIGAGLGIATTSVLAGEWAWIGRKK